MNHRIESYVNLRKRRMLTFAARKYLILRQILKRVLLNITLLKTKRVDKRRHSRYFQCLKLVHWGLKLNVSMLYGNAKLWKRNRKRICFAVDVAVGLFHGPMVRKAFAMVKIFWKKTGWRFALKHHLIQDYKLKKFIQQQMSTSQGYNLMRMNYLVGLFAKAKSSYEKSVYREKMFLEKERQDCDSSYVMAVFKKETTVINMDLVKKVLQLYLDRCN